MGSDSHSHLDPRLQCGVVNQAHLFEKEATRSLYGIRHILQLGRLARMDRLASCSGP
jgi:hypothetical protein